MDIHTIWPALAALAMAAPAFGFGAYWLHARKRLKKLLRELAELRKSSRLLEEERRVLELIAQGATLRQVLDALTDSMERLAGDCYCSVLLANPARTRLLGGSTGTLPPELIDVVNGLPIGPGAGASGSAAYWNKPVLVTDMLTDPRFERWREVNGRFGLRTCWVVPIHDSHNQVLGTFAMYHKRLVKPGQQKLDLLKSAAQLAGNAIERLTAEEALKESKERRRLIIDTALDAVVCIDARGVVSDWNPQAEKVFGWSAVEAVGQALASMIIPPQHREAHIEGMKRYAASGDTRVLNKRIEITALRRDGTEFPVELAIAPVRWKGEVHFTAFVRDITARQQAARDLALARDQAMESSRLKSEFLANMSHEIRTPMNGIMGMADLALDTDLDHDQREYLNTVKSSADSLLKIINDILDLSKIEAGRLELDPIPFNVRDQVEEALWSLAVPAHGKGLELLYSFGKDVPEFASGDPVRIRQVLINLLGNAVKFTAVGEVMVEAGVKSRTEKELELHVAVRDSGIGIAADKLTLIFEPFSQADGSTTRRFGGTGLGLTISSRLVQAMNGSIWVESEPGKGSCFHFTVRLGCVAEGSRQRLSEEKLADAAVLVVDDNCTNRRILTETLTGWGMRPRPAASAREALAEMGKAWDDRTPFPLVLTDSQMPEMNGFDLVAEIRRTPHLADTAILILTSAEHQGDIQRCRESGVSGYLTKPVRRADLRAAIAKALDGRGVSHLQGSRAEGKRGATSAPEAGVGQPNSGSRILLAEDNQVNQRVVIEILKRYPHSIVTAGNGKEALARLREQAFDLILMDVQMPELDGIETTVAIREAEKQTDAHIPIIALTARAMEGDRARCLKAGMDDYISKPIRSADLLALLARHLPSEVHPVDTPVDG